ncbi:MAG TPA: CBS domain-containing protein [Chloroflexota bacterium]|nr:CBS domain-containing protein [Chloroflexota bacterium]
MTHENADFDAIASLLAAHRLYPQAIPLLPRRVNRNVEQFLTLYWDALPFVRPSDWHKRKIDQVLLVDTHALNSVRGVVKRPFVHVIDHHTDYQPHERWHYQVEPVGATVTLLVEQLQSSGLALTVEETTLLLLGIYEDTGALTYDTTTPRDLSAAAWLLDQGAVLAVARRFLNLPLTEKQYALYDQLFTAVTWHDVYGQSVAITAAAAPDDFDEEISGIAHRLREALTPVALFMLVQLQRDVQVVARSSSDKVDVGVVAKSLGGGGHSRAAAARVAGKSLTAVMADILHVLPQAVKPLAQVADLMSYGLQTLRPTVTVVEAAEVIRRFGYEGYPVLDPASKQVVGLLTRRAVDRALSHNMDHVPISRIMKTGTVTVRPSDSIDHLQNVMLSEGWGQIPVLAEGDLAANGVPIGIVTRTDLLNYLFRPGPRLAEPELRQLLMEKLPSPLWALVRAIGEVAAELGLPLYFVGGIVRDLLLGQSPTDLDMVVEGDAIRLARQLQQTIGGEIHAHGRFGTAKWILDTAVWQTVLSAENVTASPPDPGVLAALTLSSIDFVTARTEFYREPSALPEVTHGSIKLDLHRRDFSINTLAVRLDGAFLGQLLDFYGGQRDLAQGIIRVLHSLSFVDDPTRILRAVRLEQRLGFHIEARTAELIANALPLLDRVSGSRIRHEFELAFRESDPAPVMRRLAELQILPHLHLAATWTVENEAAFGRLRPLLADPFWHNFQEDETPAFLYFALWVAPLLEPAQSELMERLRVRKMTRLDVQACTQAWAALTQLPPDARPSQVEKACRPYHPRVLLVVRVLLTDERLIDLLERYVREWQGVKTAVTGNDLRALGLKPGPRFGAILDELLAARLDGRVTDAAGERALLAKLIA